MATKGERIHSVATITRIDSVGHPTFAGEHLRVTLVADGRTFHWHASDFQPLHEGTTILLDAFAYEPTHGSVPTLRRVRFNGQKPDGAMVCRDFAQYLRNCNWDR